MLIFNAACDNILYLPDLSDTARFCFHSIISGLENIPSIEDRTAAIDIARSNVKECRRLSIPSFLDNLSLLKKRERFKIYFKIEGNRVEYIYSAGINNLCKSNQIGKYFIINEDCICN